MKDKPKEADLTLQVEQAKQLLDLGHVREALVLVMDALWQELEHLRDTLKEVQGHLPLPKNLTAVGPTSAESSETEFVWPEFPSRLLH
jgi:hypothetical protein